MKDAVRKRYFAGRTNFSLQQYQSGEKSNDHTNIALRLVEKYGTPSEIKEMKGIAHRHDSSGISHEDYHRRYEISQKYYKRLHHEAKHLN